MTDKLPPILQPTKEDIALLLAAKCHLGSRNVNNRMKPYIFSRRPDGIFIIHIGKLWEKLILAARVLVTIDRWEDIYVTSSSLRGRRPANKVSGYLGTSYNMGRFPPGQFTKSLVEPRVLLCMDPYDDAQAITESSKCNIPVIAFANSHSPLKHVDIAIPCNNLGSQSIGVMCWLLTRAVLRLRGAIRYDIPWDVIPDMFFYNEEQSVQVIEGGDGDNNALYQDDYRGGAANKGSYNRGGGKDYQQYDSYDGRAGGEWSAEQQRGFSMTSSDDGVNWQNDIPKIAGAWDDNDGYAEEQNLSFNTNWPANQQQAPATSGSSDRTYVFNQSSVAVQPQQHVVPTSEPVDWAEDVPTGQEQGGARHQGQPAEEGWDSPAEDDRQQWQGSSGNKPW